ncbi:MAG: PEP/pyruvate-binding domain-containing protein [Desulfosoma sp.]|uniref:PEP/pyruvate-binding domain-containing protein n=1 Tax=Desulfosoma sp. TaxID=2603217 RepID=UPI004049BBA2
MAGAFKRSWQQWVDRALSRLGLSMSRDPAPAHSLEELRLAFQRRYHHFKLLLNRNNRALELMTEVEEMLRGTRPFGMTFVRSRCTQVSTSVFQIIQHLEALAPEKYTPLYEAFRTIQENIRDVIDVSSSPATGPLVLPLEQVSKEAGDWVGSKMANLGEIKRHLQMNTPEGFVITTFCTARFFKDNALQEEINRRLQAVQPDRLDELFALSAQVQQLVIAAPVPEDVRKAVTDQVSALKKRLSGQLRFAVRSSSVAEDLPEMSFAGQFRSELNVGEENILEAFKGVVASKYGVAAMTYRLRRGLRDEDVAMAVGCLVMVEAVSSGVLYTRHPLHIREDVLVIHGVWGLPKSVVDGSVSPDVWIVSRKAPHAVLECRVGEKSIKYVCYPDEGVCRLETAGDESRRLCLSEAQVVELARLALGIEAHYGAPQDVEWAVDGSGNIVILQTRPFSVHEAARALEEAGLEEGRSGSEALPVLAQGGMTASSGIASGPVHVVRRDADALQCPQGAVLVVAQALPRWAPLLGQVAAVLSEQGSVAGHLGNVAREFRVPALFGVPGILERVTPGHVVTVDADQRRVYEGAVPLKASQPFDQPALMIGTPVYEVLKEVGRWITPLNLLDPESPEFSPRNCRTLHDITRFCHEKAVHEMFRFGSEHRFPQKSAKQLMCRVPMQFWIINLDDGFTEDLDGPYVTLEQIVSVPMLALWQGMTAIPWEGPPPVDTKGFMSVLMEAASNPGLDPSVASPYAVRNYFMISRNFCSLQSRFGFHFSTLEALVDERTSQNYVSFQFKGGAADRGRRVLRARFVADLLEPFDFRCEVREDAAFARLEGRPVEVMVDRLRILGYLIMHTRQLDMVMHNAGSVHRYRAKMLQEIETVRQWRGLACPS